MSRGTPQGQPQQPPTVNVDDLLIVQITNAIDAGGARVSDAISYAKGGDADNMNAEFTKAQQSLQDAITLIEDAKVQVRTAHDCGKPWTIERLRRLREIGRPVRP